MYFACCYFTDDRISPWHEILMILSCTLQVVSETGDRAEKTARGIAHVGVRDVCGVVRGADEQTTTRCLYLWRCIVLFVLLNDRDVTWWRGTKRGAASRDRGNGLSESGYVARSGGVRAGRGGRRKLSIHIIHLRTYIMRS